MSADDSRHPTAQQQREVLKSHAVWACNLWSREPVHVNMIDVLAGGVSQHQAAFSAPGRTLKIETAPAVHTAAAFAVGRPLSGGGDAMVGGVAGAGLGTVLTPGLRALGAALVVAVQ